MKDFDLDIFNFQLGMAKIFQATGDLSGIIDTIEPLYVANVIQKAFIEINEEHTEAAVASGEYRKLFTFF